MAEVNGESKSQLRKEIVEKMSRIETLRDLFLELKKTKIKGGDPLRQLVETKLKTLTDKERKVPEYERDWNETWQEHGDVTLFEKKREVKNEK